MFMKFNKKYLSDSSKKSLSKEKLKENQKKISEIERKEFLLKFET